VAAPHVRLISAFRQRKSPLIFSARPPTGPHGLAGLTPASNLSPAQALSHNTTQPPPARNKQFRRPHAPRSRNPATPRHRRKRKFVIPKRSEGPASNAVTVNSEFSGGPCFALFAKGGSRCLSGCRTLCAVASRKGCGFRRSSSPSFPVLAPKPYLAVIQRSAFRDEGSPSCPARPTTSPKPTVECGRSAAAFPKPPTPQSIQREAPPKR
jgi:hypothetical protein